MQRKPAELSGGQRQRVAMGRAMVREPRAFLMDEPLSNLDAKLRVQMRAELSRLHERLGTTTIYVTHDQVEAMTLGHRVAVLKDGVLQQVDTPQHLYRHPANLFVAAFIGSPPMNLVEATVGGASRARSPDQRIALGADAGLAGFEGAHRDPGHPPVRHGGHGRVAQRRPSRDRGHGRGHRGTRLGGERHLPDRRAARPDRGHDRGGQR